MNKIEMSMGCPEFTDVIPQEFLVGKLDALIPGLKRSYRSARQG
jgi:hypothetical protein